jgi:hypothetical protein
MTSIRSPCQREPESVEGGRLTYFIYFRRSPVNVKDVFKRKKSINDITLDELNKERIRLSNERKGMNQQVLQLEEQKKQLVLKGKDAPSIREQRMIASEIIDVDTRARGLEKNLDLFSRQLRIINGFIQIKRNKRILEQHGVSKLVNSMDLGELQSYVERTAVDENFTQDKLTELINVIEQSNEMVQSQPEPGIDQVVKYLQEMKASEQAENPQAVDEVMEKLNKFLAPEEEAEQK